LRPLIDYGQVPLQKFLNSCITNSSIHLHLRMGDISVNKQENQSKTCTDYERGIER
jgi:hypothetical protein